MPQRDYLLRQIEMLGELLIAIRNAILGRHADPAEIEDRLRSASEQAGMSLELARAATPDTLRMLIAPTGEIEPGRSWFLAEILYLDGLQAKIDGDMDRALDSLAKARVLFSLLQPMGAFLVGFPEAAERIGEIDALAEEGEAQEG